MHIMFIHNKNNMIFQSLIIQSHFTGNMQRNVHTDFYSNVSFEAAGKTILVYAMLFK